MMVRRIFFLFVFHFLSAQHFFLLFIWEFGHERNDILGYRWMAGGSDENDENTNYNLVGSWEAKKDLNDGRESWALGFHWRNLGGFFFYYSMFSCALRDIGSLLSPPALYACGLVLSFPDFTSLVYIEMTFAILFAPASHSEFILCFTFNDLLLYQSFLFFLTLYGTLIFCQ